MTGISSKPAQSFDTAITDLRVQANILTQAIAAIMSPETTGDSDRARIVADLRLRRTRLLSIVSEGEALAIRDEIARRNVTLPTPLALTPWLRSERLQA